MYPSISVRSVRRSPRSFNSQLLRSAIVSIGLGSILSAAPAWSENAIVNAKQNGIAAACSRTASGVQCSASVAGATLADAFTLPNPARLVADFKYSDSKSAKVGAPKAVSATKGDHLVKQVRFGAGPGTLRVVFDLEQLPELGITKGADAATFTFQLEATSAKSEAVAKIEHKPEPTLAPKVELKTEPKPEVLPTKVLAVKEVPALEPTKALPALTTPVHAATATAVPATPVPPTPVPPTPVPPTAIPTIAHTAAPTATPTVKVTATAHAAAANTTDSLTTTTAQLLDLEKTKAKAAEASPKASLANSAAAALAPSVIGSQSGAMEPTPTAPPSNSGKIEKVLFEKSALPGEVGASIVKIVLGGKAEAKVSKLDERTYEVMVPTFTLAGRYLSLPYFPPEGFAGVTHIKLVQKPEAVQVIVGVNRGVRIVPTTKQGELILKVIE